MNTWGLRGTLAAVGVATVIAGVGGTAIYAATGSGDHFMGMPAPPGPPGPNGPGAAHAIGGSVAGDPVVALHGEFVDSDGKGGYRTTVTQSGTVTAVDVGSLTARSADGYVQTYLVPAGVSTADFAVDDPVVIRATRAHAGYQPTVTTLRSPMFGR